MNEELIRQIVNEAIGKCPTATKRVAMEVAVRLMLARHVAPLVEAAQELYAAQRALDENPANDTTAAWERKVEAVESARSNLAAVHPAVPAGGEVMSDFKRGQAWAAGYNAALAGKPQEHNNRHPGTVYFDDWLDGWMDGDRRREHEAPDATD